MANSPEIDIDRPVSRQHEIDLNKYYGFPYVVHAPYPLRYPEVWHEPGDPHLRSTREVIGYFIQERTTNSDTSASAIPP